MAEMTPRQRVWAALCHREPDRVPFDVGGGNSTTMLVETYENFKKHCGIQAPTHLMSKAFRSAYLDDQTLVRLGSDVRPIRTRGPIHWQEPPAPEPGTFIDVFQVKWRQVAYAGGMYWEVVGHPLAEATIHDLDRFPWPDPLDPGYFRGLEEDVRHLYHQTPYALMGDSVIKGFWEPYTLLRGLEQALIDLVAEPEFFRAVMDRLMEINTAITQRFLEITGPYLSVYRMADDLASQRGPLMSPATYRKLIQPYHRRFNQIIRQGTEAKIFFHSCGNIVPLLDDLIEAGYEVLNPVQVAAFADPAGVKQRYGDRLSFWGGIDTQHVLPHGTPDGVRREVYLRIQQFGKGGGFVAAAVHNMQPDIPPENIVAMSEAVREAGRYPLKGC